MSEEIGMALEEATVGMNKAIDHLEFELNISITHYIAQVRVRCLTQAP